MNQLSSMIYLIGDLLEMVPNPADMLAIFPLAAFRFGWKYFVTKNGPWECPVNSKITVVNSSTYQYHNQKLLFYKIWGMLIPGLGSRLDPYDKARFIMCVHF